MSPARAQPRQRMAFLPNQGFRVKLPIVPLRICRALLMLLMFGTSALAQAACSAWPNNAPSLDQTISPPATTAITLAPAAIGQVMASVKLRLSGGMGNFTCGSGTLYGMTVADMSLPEGGQPKVYQTAIEGVGVRVGFREAYSGGWPETLFPPFQASDLAHGTLLSVPYYALIEFVRTGMQVGKGPVTFSYHANLDIPTVPQTVVPFRGSNLRFNLTHNSYYTSCVPTEKTYEVPMGGAFPDQVIAGTVPVRTFAFDVHCEGMNPSTPPPVKVHFQGNAQAGLLALQDAGQDGVAQGVAIELKDGGGTALPFSPDDALPLDWRSGSASGQRYRFSGQARYVPDGNAIRPGRADASLTFVLVYN